MVLAFTLRTLSSRDFKVYSFINKKPILFCLSIALLLFYHIPLFLCLNQNKKLFLLNTFHLNSTMSAFGKFVVVMAVVMLAISLDKASAGDPDMLQDVCVADLTNSLTVNGYLCKKNFSEIDFSSMAIAKAGATNNTFGSLVTGANVMKVPGLNTLGVSMARIDYAPGGINPPHTHPRATEMIFVLEGELDVGFITTSNVLITKHIVKGEVFAFPRGLVHFQQNNGDVPAAVVAGFNSQLPGTQSIATTLFASSPTVPDSVLTKTFQVGTKEIQKIKSRLAPKK
ncbi:germin-like protein 5-1 [Solanum lycopersicum]